jgi:transcription elongation factor Elf1
MSTARKETRTYADRREYLIQAVTKRRQVLKRRAVELMGGRCLVCNIEYHSCVFDFHHVFPDQKSFGISGSGITRSWESVQLELRKCIIVCSNCHRQISLGLFESSEIEKIYNNFWK